MKHANQSVPKSRTLGFALCGAFPALESTVAQMERLRSQGHRILPLMSECVSQTDTPFGQAANWIQRIETICGSNVLHTIPEAYDLADSKSVDALILCPCTGNTLTKLSLGIADSTVATAAHFAQCRGIPVVVAVYTLAMPSGAELLKRLYSQSGVFLVPYGPDPSREKAWSSDFTLIGGTVAAALEGIRLQSAVPG